MSVLINCGFLEPQQNEMAVEMMRLFCRQNHYPFGSVLKIGSGEAILDSPFRFLAVRKIRRFADSIAKGDVYKRQGVDRDGSVTDVHEKQFIGQREKVLAVAFEYRNHVLIQMCIRDRVMPVFIPVSDMIGITRQTTILAFNFGDGF